ncbi:hypothetical protein QVD17_34940 [Tagetes erecta]|uniref:Uncharacterized protein n=1 Tax=Tagetes erecta TaxID=13708 RepID=A0AAD8K4Y2_TARER|nr:hypothetical protein QVD17_34940 [Tagetes erecta]
MQSTMYEYLRDDVVETIKFELDKKDRIFEQQDKIYENRMKRVKRLDEEWNWSEVIELDGSDEKEKNLFKDSTS